MSIRKSRFTASVFGILLSASIHAQVTQRVSLDSAGVQGNGGSFMTPEIESAISADGRFVVFWSEASNLVPGDTNGARDVFIRDRETGTTERVSVDTAGKQASEESFDPSISADGRFVAFTSRSGDLAPGDANNSYDVFVRDLQTQTTARVSVASDGTGGNQHSYNASISADGRYVAFQGTSTNLVAQDNNEVLDVFVHDRQTGTTVRASVDSAGAESNGASEMPSISGDGRYVAFESLAANLVAEDTNGFLDVFVRDLQNGTTELASVDSTGGECDGHSSFPSISVDGRFVTFESAATDIVPGDTNGNLDVFIRDLQSDANEHVSLSSDETAGNADSSRPSVSGDGRYVAFTSHSANLVSGDTNGGSDIFVRDRHSTTTLRASVQSGGAQAGSQNFDASISADGRYVAFGSLADNLSSGDTNGTWDIFLHDRAGAPNFASVCDPGVGDVQACPCSNPPNGAGRGCDNSSATGGASLFASGGSYLSSDSLVFTTSGERPTAFGILLQGTTLVPNGLIYGQGIRCVGGSLKRLFAKNAVGGSITAPDFGAGDPTVTARSAAKGDVIAAGQSRWYLVFYRDPSLLGGCTASSTFNATQTGHIAWFP